MSYPIAMSTNTRADRESMEKLYGDGIDDDVFDGEDLNGFDGASGDEDEDNEGKGIGWDQHSVVSPGINR